MTDASEKLIETLQAQIRELTEKNAALSKEQKDRRHANKALQEELDAARKQVETLTTDRDQWKNKAEARPGELGERIQELEGKLKARAIEDKFAPIAKQLADGLTLQQLFKLNDFDAQGADLESLDVEATVKAWREATPALFRSGETPNAAPGGATRSRLEVPVPTGRGAPDTTAGGVTYRRDEVRKSGWEERRPELLKAFADNTARLID